MRILLATHYFGSHKGGVELVAQEMYRRLTENGQQVTWIAGDATPPPEPIDDSRCVPLPVWNFVERQIGVPFPIPTPRAFLQIRAAVRNSDVIILHDCLYLSNIATFVLAKFQRLPILLIQHTVPNETGFANLLMKLATFAFTRPMLSRADQVVYISETTRHYYGPLTYRQPPKVLFNGIDPEFLRPPRQPEMKLTLRRQLNLPADTSVILFVGRFVEKKGLPILRRLAEIGSRFFWVFAGWGPMDPNSWGASNVRVFSGLERGSLADVYHASDVLVLPSKKEGFPLVIQEALACGLPVVCGADTATSDPRLAQFVKAVQFSADDAQSARDFLSAIEETLHLEDASDNLAERRREFACSQYSWSNAIDSYITLMHSLVRPEGPEARKSGAEIRNTSR